MAYIKRREPWTQGFTISEWSTTTLTTSAVGDGDRPAVATLAEVVVTAPSGKVFLDGVLTLAPVNSKYDEVTYIGQPTDNGTKWKFLVQYQGYYSGYGDGRTGTAYMTVAEVGA